MAASLALARRGLGSADCAVADCAVAGNFPPERKREGERERERLALAGRLGGTDEPPRDSRDPAILPARLGSGSRSTRCADR